MSDIIYLRLNIIAASFSGLWYGFHFKSPIKRTLYKYYGTLAFLTFICYHITEYIDLFQVITNLPVMMENAGITFLYTLCFARLIILRFRTKRIEQLFDRIRNEEQRVFTRSEEELKIYYETVDNYLNIIKIIWGLCVGTIIGFWIARPAEYLLLGPQEIHHYKIPFLFSSWFPFDKYAPGYYTLAYLIQVFSGILGAYYVAVSDTFYVGFINFGIGQYKMIQCAIRNLHIVNHSNEHSVQNADDLVQMDVYKEVTDIIKHHCRINEYYEDLEKIISPIIFLQFIITSLMICAVALQGIMSGLSVRFMLSFEYAVGLLIELFIYYWHANEVTFQSGNIGNAVADSKWYKFSPRVKQALMILMLRSNKPATLSVGGFYVMSLNTFVMILKSTYSFLALFKTMSD